MTFIRGAQASNALVEAARASGIHVDTIREAGAWDVRTLGRLREIIGAMDPDIVQTHSVKSHFLMRMSR
ncbi:MAG TPA: hypothetical protein VKS01_02290, partial [Bryobacteraceae bacterium]|nr:hypothetical protein [Bryobacteraceae bacterium]